MSDIVKKDDQYSMRSSSMLKMLVKREVVGVFKNALKCIEIKFGRDFDGFETIRADILRQGNNAVRNIEQIINEQFNVENIPDVHTINFRQCSQDEKGERI